MTINNYKLYIIDIWGKIELKKNICNPACNKM